MWWWLYLIYPYVSISTTHIERRRQKGLFWTSEEKGTIFVSNIQTSVLDVAMRLYSARVTEQSVGTDNQEIAIVHWCDREVST